MPVGATMAPLDRILLLALYVMGNDRTDGAVV